MKKVICVGSATKDIFLGVNIEDKQPEKICLEAGVKIYSQSYREAVGGGAVNVGAGLSKLGYRAFVFARTDKTITGKWIQKQIGKLKLKKNYLQQTGKIPSETSVIISDAVEQDRTIIRSGDSVENFNLIKACERFKEKVDWIYLSSQKKNNLENIDILINFAKEKKAGLAFNPSSYQIENSPEEVLTRLSEIDIVFMNLDEATGLLGESAGSYRSDDSSERNDLMQKLFDKYFDLPVKTLVITDGPNGAWAGAVIKGETKIYYLPAEEIENIADTTGAGDAFVSGFLASCIKDESELEMPREIKLQRALAGGLVNSSNVITEIGATNGLLKPSALQKRVERMLSNKMV